MRAQHETEIQESEAIRGAIMASSLDSIVTIDDTGRILDFNPTAERQFGRPEREVVGQDVMPLMFGAESRGEFRRLLDRCREPGRGQDAGIRAELTAVHSGGRQGLSGRSLDQAVQLYADGCCSPSTCGTSRSASRRGRSAAWRPSPSESPSPVLRVDPHGVVLYANAASEMLLGPVGVPPCAAIAAFWQLQVRAALEDGTQPRAGNGVRRARLTRCCSRRLRIWAT